MIAATELRIGNKVLEEGVVRVVSGIIQFEVVNHVFLDDDPTGKPLENMQPVPLSKEVIDGCWYEEAEDGFWYEPIANVAHPLYLHHLNGKWGYSLTDPRMVASWQPILWLHQLQNLHFALNGQDL